MPGGEWWWWPIEYRVGRQIKRTNIHAAAAEIAVKEAQRLLHWGRDFKSIAGEPMTQTATPDVRSISLDELRLSKTHGQVERRKHIDDKRIDELAESIKTFGVLQPIVVRPVNGHSNNWFEIVAGECRYLAAKKAKLAEIICTVRPLTDEQAVEVQLIENLQRQDLHELAEAEGYEQLKALGFSPEQIADKVGKSKATVYARMKLLALCKEARTAFYAGKLSASTALLLARIPGEGQQKKALKDLTVPRWPDGPLPSVRESVKIIHDNYMLKLGDAPFPTDDADLVPSAGTCGACPKRTGNQPQLFEDVKGADVCTDPPCFQLKREASLERQRERAQAEGSTVISGAPAKKIMPWSNSSTDRGSGYVALTQECDSDPKFRTYKQLLGKAAPAPVLVEHPQTGVLVPVIKLKDIKPLLKKQGIRDDGHRVHRNEDSLRQKKAKQERVYRTELFKAIQNKAPQKLGRTELERVAIAMFERLEQEVQKRLIPLWDWEPKTTRRAYGSIHHDFRATAALKIPTLNDSGLARMIFDCSIARDLQVFAWSTNDRPDRMLAAAKRLKINADKIRKACAPANKAKRKAARK